MDTLIGVLLIIIIAAILFGSFMPGSSATNKTSSPNKHSIHWRQKVQAEREIERREIRIEKLTYELRNCKPGADTSKLRAEIRKLISESGEYSRERAFLKRKLEGSEE